MRWSLYKEDYPESKPDSIQIREQKHTEHFLALYNYIIHPQ